MQEVFALSQKWLFKYLQLLLKICQKHKSSILHIEHMVNIRNEDPTKITITNASIDKQKALKCDYIYINWTYRYTNRGFRRLITYTIIFRRT